MRELLEGIRRRLPTSSAASRSLRARRRRQTASRRCVPVRIELPSASNGVTSDACDRGRFAHDRVPDQVRVRVPGEAALGSVDAAGEHVSTSADGLRVDVLAADPDGGGTEEAQPLRRRLVRHLDEAEVELDAELQADALDECTNVLLIVAAVEV